MDKQNAGIHLRILIIKSSPNSLDYSEILNRNQMRYEIYECISTLKALGISQKIQPNCILLDWEPSKTEELFQHYEKDLIPVVIIGSAKHGNIIHSNYLIKETLTKELLSFAIDQAIAQTELKRKLAIAEQKLQQSQDIFNFEAYYRKPLFDSSINGIVILDKAGNIIEANASFAKMLGYELAEITTLNLENFEARWTKSELEQKRYKSQLWSNSFETRHRRKDGSIYDVEISSNSMNWYGQPVEFCICRDISDRKKVEALLELQNRFFRCLAIGDPLPSTLDLLLRLIELEINQAICGILVVNNRGRLSPIPNIYFPNSCDLLFAEMTINEAEIIFGKSSLNLIDIANNPQWQNYRDSFRSQDLHTCWAIPITIRNGQQVLGYLNLYFSDHQIIVPVEYEHTIIKFATYVIGIAIERHLAEIDLQMQLQKEQILSLRIQQELSDRQAAEEKLRQSQELLSLTIQNTPVGICTFDLSGRFLTANYSICKMFGYAAEAILRQSILQLTHPDYREISMDGIQQLITGVKKSVRIEKQYLHQTGREIDAISRIRLIKDVNGKPLHFVASVEDITKQKQMKIALDQRMEQQSFLMMITQQIRQSLNLDRVLETAVNEVQRLLGSDQVAIIQLFPDGATKIVEELIDPVFASILNFNYLDLNFFSKWDDSLINGKTLVLNDVPQNITFDEQTEIPSFQSKIIAPIVQNVKNPVETCKWQKNGNHLWGLLIIHSYGAFRQWQSEEAELIQHIANQLAIAIQQANLYAQTHNELLARQSYEQELQKQAAGDRLLSEITVAISQSINISDTLDIALRKLQQFMGVDRVLVYRLSSNYRHDYKGTVTKEAVSRSELSIIDNTIEDSCFATTDIAEQYCKGKVTVLPDISSSKLNPCYINLLQQLQVKANLVLPILHGNQLWGLFILHQCDRPRNWQLREITFLQQIATQIGIAGQRENLYLQLSNELSQKKVLLKEIHHRVKNNLQVMSSILYLQFRNTPPEIKLLSEEYQSRILSMSLIHDQLYRSDDLAHIDFHSYIENLTTNLFQCYGTNQELISIEIEAKNVFLPLDQSIPLGLIINELISNALKYAFPKMHGHIIIKLVQSIPNIILTISDDGVGIPPDYDLTTSDGLGMQLIQSLTEQLDGEFSFDGKNGLMVQIAFPMI